MESGRRAGWDPQLVSQKPGTIMGVNHHDPADTFDVDRILGEVSAEDYDALVIPGGVAKPDVLRTDARAVDFVRAFVGAGKPTRCHLPRAVDAR